MRRRFTLPIAVLIGFSFAVPTAATASPTPSEGESGTVEVQAEEDLPPLLPSGSSLSW